MNNVILSGRLTRDPDIYRGTKEDVARYTLAVSRTGSDDADFINCVVFKKGVEFVEKYLKKGMKIIIRGRINTSSYKNKAGDTIYTQDVVVDSHEFCEKKKE